MFLKHGNFNQIQGHNRIFQRLDQVSYKDNNSDYILLVHNQISLKLLRQDCSYSNTSKNQYLCLSCFSLCLPFGFILSFQYTVEKQLEKHFPYKHIAGLK